MNKRFVDHLQREISVPFPPQRIVSLCPSITETLFALGLKGTIVGRTRYCIHPAIQVERVAIVGGTKKIQEEKIVALQPQLIIAEKEENTKDMVASLEQKFPVFVADVQDWQDALRLIGDLGQLTGKEREAERLVSHIRAVFSVFPLAGNDRVAYLLWQKPWMAAGRKTYIHSLLQTCGFINVFGERDERYPVVSEEEITKAHPDLLFLSSEPFPFAEPHRAAWQRRLPQAKVVLVNGEVFSWYGVRMLKFPSYIRRLIQENGGVLTDNDV